MPNISNPQAQPATKSANCKSSKTAISYRGFSSIDQEIEREIAMEWFTSSDKSSFSQRNFLLKKESL